MGRWIHFPLRPLDLTRRAHPRFVTGVMLDLVRKQIARPRNRSETSDTFASVLEQGLGSTICREFYFPYARKIWGLEPGEISPVQAYKRVSAGSIGKLIKRLMPGGAGSGARHRKGIFYYPRHGYGQICERLRDAAEEAGACVHLGATVRRIDRGTPGGVSSRGGRNEPAGLRQPTHLVHDSGLDTRASGNAACPGGRGHSGFATGAARDAARLSRALRGPVYRVRRPLLSRGGPAVHAGLRTEELRSPAGTCGDHSSLCRRSRAVAAMRSGRSQMPSSAIWSKMD